MSPVEPLSEEQCLVDAMALLHHEMSGNGCERTEAAAAVMGSRVALPSGVPVWRHVSADGRELEELAYEGESLTVHSLEPAGASFLVHRDGEPHARRGPAMTLRRTDGNAAELLVVFSSDIGSGGQ
jgi:hypothetical protein